MHKEDIKQDASPTDVFRIMFEQSPLSIQVFSPDGRTLMVNRAWEELWGVTLNLISDYNILEDQQLVAKGVMPFIKKGFAGEATAIPPIMYDPEETLPRRTKYRDARRWVRAFIYPVKDAEGKVREVILMHEDITEQKRGEALQKEHEFLEAVLDNIEDGIVACDSSGVLTIFNRATRKFHGLPEEPLSPDQWANHYDLYLPDKKTPMKREDIPLFRALQGEKVHNLEIVIAPKHAPPRILIANGRAIYDADGNKLGAVVSIHDITQRKQAEEELQRSYSILHAVIEGTPDAIFVKDLEGHYLLVNSACARFLGKSVKEIIGKKDEELYSPETARQFIKQDHQVITTGETQSFEGIATGQGVKQTYLVTKAAYRDHEGVVIGLIGISHDITERKKAEEQRIAFIREQEARKKAEEANRLKDEFLATLSHELRTPLTSIFGWARLLRSGDLNEEITGRALEAIERNTQVQKQLIDDILDVSRIITGKLHLEKQLITLVPVIEGALDSVRLAAEAKHIQLEVIAEQQVGLVLGDSNRLQQVIWNLLSNAIKFTPEGGRVELRLGRSNSTVQIHVSDTGQGISPEFLPYVFDRFRQADQTTTRKYGGLGLGLAIVRHLVELHGGTVSVESKGSGQGSTFTVELPIAEEPIEEQRSEEKKSDDITPPGRSPMLDNLRVLVVDDEADTLSFLITVLENCGAEVVPATSAAEAIQIIKEKKPDILIADIGMPHEDGYELISKVRELEKGSNDWVPAIALTAYAREEDRWKSIRAGYQMHMTKPVEPSELIEAIASFSRRANGT